MEKRHRTKNVNADGLVPSVFDGAGEIEQQVGQEKVDALQNAVEASTGNMTPAEYMTLMQQLKTKPVVRDHKKIGRNDPCPCGAVDENGKPKKYKNCCFASGKYETRHQI